MAPRPPQLNPPPNGTSARSLPTATWRSFDRAVDRWRKEGLPLRFDRVTEPDRQIRQTLRVTQLTGEDGRPALSLIRLARESNWQPLVGAIDDSWPELSAAVRRGVDIDEIVQIMMATTTSVGATVSRGIGFILKVLALDGVDTKHYRRRAEFRATRFGARNSPGTTSTAAEAPAITVAVEQLFRQLATYEQTLGSALAAGNIKLAKHCADELRQMRAELKGNASGDSQL